MALRSLRSVLSLLLVLAVVSSSVAAPLAPAQLKGRVLEADGRTPRTGVTVVLVDESGQPRYRSEPSSARGVFRIHGASAGTYRLLAETSEGAFLAPQAVDLPAGETRALSLSLNPGQPEPTPPAPEPTPEPTPAPPEPAPSEPTTPPPAEPTTPPPATPAPVTPVQDGPQWRKWIIVGGIGVAALLVINEMSDEDEASPF